MSQPPEEQIKIDVKTLDLDELVPAPFKPGTVVQQDLKQNFQIKFTNLGQELIKMREGLRQSLQVVGRVLHENQENFRRFKEIVPAIASIPWKEIIERQGRAVSFAGSHGWFIQPGMSIPLISRITKLADTEDIEGLDTLMVEAIRAELDDIEAFLVKHYPRRSEIIVEAFKLYHEKRYFAAIPLFISQAEGVALEATNKSPFNDGKGSPKIAPEIDKRFAADTVRRMFANPLRSHHPLSKPKAGKLNRHRVLHGNDVDYGTEFNALQAISFLGNIAWILSVDVIVKRTVENGGVIPE